MLGVGGEAGYDPLVHPVTGCRHLLLECHRKLNLQHWLDFIRAKNTIHIFGLQREGLKMNLEVKILAEVAEIENESDALHGANGSNTLSGHQRGCNSKSGCCSC